MFLLLPEQKTRVNLLLKWRFLYLLWVLLRFIREQPQAHRPYIALPHTRELPIIQEPQLASLLIYFFVYSFERSLPGRVPREREREREPTHLLIQEPPFQLRCWLTGIFQRQTLNRSNRKGMGSKYRERTQNPRNSFRPTITIKLTNCTCFEISKHPW